MMHAKHWIVCVLIISTATMSFGSTNRSLNKSNDILKRTIISVFIPQSKNSDHKIILRKYNDLNLIKNSEEYTAESSSGYFKFELILDRIQPITLAIDSDDNYYLQNLFGSISIHIEPGDSLFVQIPNLDCIQLSQVSFFGKGIEKQQVRQKIFEKVSKIIFKRDSSKSLLEQSIKNNVILRNELLSSLNEEIGRISQEAYNSLQREILTVLYHSSAELFLTSDLKNSETRKTYRQLYKSNFIIETDLLLKESNIVGGFYLKSVIQKDAFLNYLMMHNLQYSIDFRNDMLLHFQILKETYNNFPIQNELLASFIIQRVKHKGWDADLDSIARDYYKYVYPGDYYREQVVEIEMMYKQNLSRGSDAFKFALPDTSQRIVSLDQFLGNVVLLDFMYYGCAGCALMAPKLEEIEALFRDSSVVFVSISIDRTPDQLKRSIGKFASKNSIHLYTNGKSYDHEVIQRYQVNSYPTLVLIDSRGKIVTARAPDPRSQSGKNNLITLIQSTLEDF